MSKIPRDYIINQVMKQIQFDVKKEFDINIDIEDIEKITASQFALVSKEIRNNNNEEGTAIYLIGFGKFEMAVGRKATEKRRRELIDEGKSKTEIDMMIKEEYYEMKGFKR